jgi:hypothetical protein
MVCVRLLSHNQTTFIKVRFILESIVAAHEIVHDAIKRGEKCMVLKLDYEKVYNRVSWDFLEEILITSGFGQKWRNWVLKLVKGGSIAVRLNDANNSYFKPGKGLRQVDPLSPLLFNLVVDVFTRILSKAAIKGYIHGLFTNRLPEEVVSLQYADDTLLFLAHDTYEARHLE